MKAFFWIVLIATIYSCNSEEKRTARKPHHAGKSGEVLLVLDRELIGSVLEDALEKALTVPLARNPQSEPRNQTRTVAAEDLADHNKLHRNLVFVELGRPSKKVSVSRDVWANGQLVLRIVSPDMDAAVETVNANAEQIIELIEQEERFRTMSSLGFHRAEALEERVFNEHGVRFIIPEEYRKIRSIKNFEWFEVDRIKYKGGREHHSIQGILLYHYPYTNDSLLEVSSLSITRDSILRRELPGPTKGSYMTTEYKFRDIDLSPIAWETEHNGMYAVYQQGLWKMENNYMGGPYVSLTQIDSVAGRVITLEGFVYSPEFPKREMLREMDAIVHSLDIDPQVEIKPE